MKIWRHFCVLILMMVVISDSVKVYRCRLQVQDQKKVEKCKVEKCSCSDNCGEIIKYKMKTQKHDGSFRLEAVVPRITKEWVSIQIHEMLTCLNISIPEFQKYKNETSVLVKVKYKTFISRVERYSLQMIPPEKCAKLTVVAIGYDTLFLTLFMNNQSVGCSNGARDDYIRYEVYPLNGEKVIKTFNFTDLTPQMYYCAQMNMTDVMLYTEPEFLEESTSNPALDIPSSSSLRQDILTLGASSIAIFAFVVVVLAGLYSIPCGRQRMEMLKGRISGKQNKFADVFLKNPQKVLLLYSRDDPHFHKVMVAFKEALEKCGNMDVLDPLDELLPENNRGDLSEWLYEHLNLKSVKVIIVQSELAVRTQKALFCRRRLQYSEPRATDRLFSQALSYFHGNLSLSSDYSRVFPVRFEGLSNAAVKLKLITPLTCYIQPKHFHKLIGEIHGLSFTEDSELENMLKCEEMKTLENEIENMKHFCVNNPDYIKKLISIY